MTIVWRHHQRSLVPRYDRRRRNNRAGVAERASQTHRGRLQTAPGGCGRPRVKRRHRQRAAGTFGKCRIGGRRESQPKSKCAVDRRIAELDRLSRRTALAPRQQRQSIKGCPADAANAIGAVDATRRNGAAVSVDETCLSDRRPASCGAVKPQTRPCCGPCRLIELVVGHVIAIGPTGQTSG